MRYFSSGFASSLVAAREQGIAPVYFAHFVARDRETGAPFQIGFWSGDEDITVTVETPAGSTAARTYSGGSGLTVDGLQYVADLTDNPVTVGLSQISDAAQALIRGADARLAYVEIHASCWNGGILAGVPQLQYVGIVDEGPISTPGVGGEGAISLAIRSEIMTQLQTVNPAKSSNAHQRGRSAGDLFCEFASTVSARKIIWRE